MTTEVLTAVFRCPSCRSALWPASGASVACAGCGAVYLLDSYGPDLVPPDLARRYASFRDWEQVLASLADWRRRTWDGSAVAKAKTNDTAEIAQALLDRASPFGRVLDVGCGSGWMQPLLAARGSAYVGIDPLPVQATYPFPFARAVSDCLPFADASFDGCLFFSSIDYSLVVDDTLQEAHRIVKPGGVIAIGTPIHTKRDADGERLHHHRFLAGDLEALIAAVFGRYPAVWPVRPSYRVMWTHRLTA